MTREECAEYRIMPHHQHRPLSDSVSKNALARFRISLQKRFAEQMQVMDEVAFQAFDQAHASVDFVAAIIAEKAEREDSDGVASMTSAKKSASKRKTPASRKRSASVRSTASPEVEGDLSTDSIASTATTTRRSSRKPKPVAKKPQVIWEESDEDNDDDAVEDDAQSDDYAASKQVKAEKAAESDASSPDLQSDQTDDTL